MARPHIGEMTDDGEYYVAALALAHGQGYTLPSRPDIPTSKYPPGLSLTSAPILHFFPSYNAARVVVTLFGVLLFLAGFKFLRDWGLGERESVLLMIAVMFQPAVLFWPMIMVSDVPFAAIVLTFFCLKGETRKSLVLLGVLAAYGYLLRSNGIILLLAGVVIAKRRTLYLLGGFLLLAVPVKLWLAQGRGETYGDNLAFFTHHNLKQILGLFAGNAWAYFQTFGLWIYPIIETNKFQRVGIVFVMAAVIPLALGLRWFRSWPFALFALANLALFVVWPWAVGIRAFIWLGPAILFCWYKGWGRWRNFALAITLICAALMTAMTVKRNHHITDPDYDAAMGYIKSSTPPDSVVASYMPESVYLYTGHQGCRTLLDRDFMSEVQGNWTPIDECAKDRPLYLLIPLGNIFEAQGAALVHNAPRSAVLEFQNDHFRIYRIGAK